MLTTIAVVSATGGSPGATDAGSRETPGTSPAGWVWSSLGGTRASSSPPSRGKQVERLADPDSPRTICSCGSVYQAAAIRVFDNNSLRPAIETNRAAHHRRVDLE